MPAPLYPTYPSTPVNSSRPHHTTSQLSQPQLKSGDQLHPLPGSALVEEGKRAKKFKRYVQFASDFADNEIQSKSRPKSPSGAKLLKSSLTTMRLEASNPSLKAAAANTSAKMIVPPSTSLPRPEHGHRGFDHHRECSPSRSGHSLKRSSSLRNPAQTLPPVPDAPKTLKPPSAPRPARLPTPDLPEVDGEMMFGQLPAIKKSCFAIQDPRPRSAYQKMNVQIGEALAYMEARRREQ